ncbi:MAG: 30S ribosomal protein S12 methylthiotransferase RimO [Bacteroidales bacterium]|nr:30S ribosomal protein S12 methylthiotransferase RimO [Bacteroidales bacterium]
MHSIQVITLGCSKNTVDTEHLLAQLPPDAFTILPEDHEGPADYLLINTCGFIGDAKQQSIDTILAHAARRKSGEVGKFFVFGCLSQRYASQLPSLIPEVDGWFGARDLDPVLKALGVTPQRALRNSRRFESDGRAYAYIKISEGCDRRCSYCAIPFIRGAHRSVPMEDVLEEARLLAERGVKELIIIAQDTTYYGLDLYGRRALAELLRKLSAVDGIEWLRLHYSYPEGFPEDVLDEMASNPKICKYLDIPLQHISDKVLHNMHRGVTGQWTRSLIARLREKVPGLVLRTTVIVGHPGEGPEEFGELLDFAREARFERLGAFTYSEEEGTWGAENLADDVPQEEKQRRYDELMAMQEGISAQYNASRVGSIEKVLVDDVVGAKLICRSQYESPEVDGEIIVSCPEGSDPRSFVGKFAQVRILASEDYDLIGEII